MSQSTKFKESVEKVIVWKILFKFCNLTIRSLLCRCLLHRAMQVVWNRTVDAVRVCQMQLRLDHGAAAQVWRVEAVPEHGSVVG